MKKLFDKYTVPSPTWGVFDKNRLSLPEKISFPVILKPAWEHCSIGLSEESVVSSPNEVELKVRAMGKKFREPILIEEFLSGNEYQVVVIERDGKPWVLPPCETVYKSRFGKLSFITFEDNWFKEDIWDKVERVGAADTQNLLVKQTVEIARRGWEKLGCQSYVRFDMREEEGRPYVLEVNVNPGIGWDEDEDIRVAAEAAGLDLGDVIQLILDSAVFDYDSVAF